jgi:uncharacterized membrane protein
VILEADPNRLKWGVASIVTGRWYGWAWHPHCISVAEAAGATIRRGREVRGKGVLPVARYKLTEERRRRMIRSQLNRTRNPRLAKVVERNIGTLIDFRQTMEQSKCLQDRVADWITAFSGSMFFVYLHVVWFAAWIVINRGWTPIKPFDPEPFGLLTLIVSLEAIFLATFVLVSQNRMTEVADKRADLDLQINLLSEYEITRVLSLVDAIAEHLGLEIGQDPEVEELKNDVKPDEVLNEMERRKKDLQAAGGTTKA